jgi:hypothetical protein
VILATSVFNVVGVALCTLALLAVVAWVKRS